MSSLSLKILLITLITSLIIFSGCVHKKQYKRDVFIEQDSQAEHDEIATINPEEDLIEQIQQPNIEKTVANITEKHTINFQVENENINLNAMLVRPDDGQKHPAVLIIPSSGKISRFGKRWFKNENFDKESGQDNRLKEIAVHKAYAQLFSSQGYIGLSWDKRSCAKKDDIDCEDYSQSDINSLGPIAYSKDLDAACQHLQNHPNFNGQIILFAHGQATQIALQSECIKNSKALLLVAPLPRSVDKVMVSALYEKAKNAQKSAKNFKKSKNQQLNTEEFKEQKQTLLENANHLKNKAGSLEATFDAISKDRFPKNAQVLGASPHYWKEWIKLTEESPKNTAALIPWIIVRGDKDLQYSQKDLEIIDRLVEKNPNSSLILLKNSDHYLMPLDQEKFVRILEALDLIISEQKQPSS